MFGMKLKLGFWIGDENMESVDTPTPPFPTPMDDSTWQSPYIFLPSLAASPFKYISSFATNKKNYIK